MLESEQKKRDNNFWLFPLPLPPPFFFFFFFSLHKVLEFVQKSLNDLTLTYAGANVCVKQLRFPLI